MNPARGGGRGLRHAFAGAVATTVLVAAVAGPAAAQWAPPQGWHRLSIGAGPSSAESRLAPVDRSGASALAAFELLATRRVELRFSGTLFEGRDDALTQLGGVAVDAVVFPFRGAVQPYAGVGVGVYKLTVDDTAPGAVDPTIDHVGAAWTALVGSRVRAGPLTPFVEYRRSAFGNGAPMRHYSPLILGLHF